MPTPTLDSTILALVSLVLMGWLFEARGRLGLTRGVGWVCVDEDLKVQVVQNESEAGASSDKNTLGLIDLCTKVASRLLHKFGKVFYVSFFSVVHLMKLHSLSLIWGVTSETMEYEEQAEIRECRLRIRQKELMRKNGNGGGNDLNINSTIVIVAILVVK